MLERSFLLLPCPCGGRNENQELGGHVVELNDMARDVGTTYHLNNNIFKRYGRNLESSGHIPLCNFGVVLSVHELVHRE